MRISCSRCHSSVPLGGTASSAGNARSICASVLELSLETVPRQKPESAQDQLGIVQGRGLPQKQHPVLDQKFRVRKARAQLLKLVMERKACRRDLLQHLHAHMMNRARVAEVQTHPFRGAEGFSVAITRCSNRARRVRHAYFLRGRSVLRFPGQSIVVAIVAEMQKASNGHQGVERRPKRFLKRGRQDRVVAGPHMILLDRGQQREPANHIVIAQSARPVLYIGFQVEDGASELAVPRAGRVLPAA